MTFLERGNNDVENKEIVNLKNLSDIEILSEEKIVNFHKADLDSVN